MRCSPMNSGEKLKFCLSLQNLTLFHLSTRIFSLLTELSLFNSGMLMCTRVQALNERMPAFLFLLFAFILKAHHPVCIWVITIPSFWSSRTYPPALIFGQFRPTQ
ncbi:unnamed protein product [Rangifer tarandus platyrhynchus]|uniref:Uncharacterized protein n=1 Tax=Rangifer tarandus platyrhynchus TaxID=3082113 RepID=A0ABN8ZHT6_RANTA|nr:unnamed protein product [Rangifer tarandus platyrhynchus]